MQKGELALKEEKNEEVKVCLHQFYSVLRLYTDSDLNSSLRSPTCWPQGNQEREYKRLWSNSSPIQVKLYKLQVFWAHDSRHAELSTP